MALNSESQKKIRCEFSIRNLFKIVFFTILIYSESLKSAYVIEKEPILELQHSKVKIYRGTIKADERKILIKVLFNNGSTPANIFLETEINVHNKHRPEYTNFTMADYKFELFYKTINSSHNGMAAFIYKDNGENILKNYIAKKMQKNNFMVDEALEILRNILINLKFFDSHEIRFVNLSIENIFIDKKGEIHFPDLYFISVNNSKLVNSCEWEKLMAIGKHVVAPELMVSNAQLNRVSDMYSFGIIMEEIYRFINFENPHIVKCKFQENYEDLMRKCLEINPTERITIEEALKHSLFQPLLPDIYDIFASNVSVDNQSITMFRMDNILYYSSKTEYKHIKITQLTENLTDDLTLHISKPEDIEIEINDHKTSLYFIKRAELDEIQFIFELVKYSSLKHNKKSKKRSANSPKPQIKIEETKPEDQDLSIQKKYLQNLRQRRKKQKSRFRSISRKIMPCF